MALKKKMDVQKQKQVEVAEEEEEEVQKPTAKGKSKAKPEPEDEEEEPQSSNPYMSEVVKGALAKALAKGRSELPFVGEYELVAKKFRVVMPDAEKGWPGFIGVTFEVAEGPEDEPETGWPEIEYRFFKLFPEVDAQGKKRKLEKKEQQQKEISATESWRFVFACVGELDDDEEYAPLECIKECIGAHVLAFNKESKDGQYKNLGNWKPVD